MEIPSETKSLVNPGVLLLLGITVFLLLFFNGLYIVFIATWLAPLFFIRFLRSQRILTGLLIGLLVNVVVTIITWRGMIPVPGALIIMVGGVIGIISFMPYLIDRWLWGKTIGFSGTLVFPCAWTANEYVNSLINPYATWGSLAYTQFDGTLALMQLVSVTGIWGPVFLISWFASLVNWMWENSFNWTVIKRGVSIYLSVLIGVLFIGGIRLSLFPPSSKTVRIASIVGSSKMSLRGEVNNADGLKKLREKSLNIQMELMRLSGEAAAGHADIIFWHEAAAPVLEKDKKSLISLASKFTKDQGVYLMLSVYIRPTDYPRRQLENKIVMIDPKGDVRFEYMKAKPIPGDNTMGGDGMIPFLDTPFGRIGAAICFDMDFPGLIRQAGKKNIDVMLVPANDWKEINPIHTYMASIRSIENGFSMVRSTKDGLSASFDYQGRLLNSMDDFTSDKKIMFSDVPIKSIRTIYPITRDIFAWISMIGITLFIFTGIYPLKRLTE